MIGKKINQLATELAPTTTDLTIIGDPVTGVSKKITLEQLGAIFGGAVSFYTTLGDFPVTGVIDIIYCAKDTKKLYLWSGSAYVEVFPSQSLLDTYQLRSEKGVSNGYASLDVNGKVPIGQLPNSIMEYKGTWNAATNTPTLANGTGDTGDVYICSVAGTVNFGAGPITFAVGDYVVYSGTIWQRSSGAVGTVTSVAVSNSGDALAITGSPITTSGTINIGFAGTGAQYIKGDGTLATFPNTIAQAQNLITEVYNNTGATLTKGTIVYINGGQGNLPTVTKALATSDATSAQTYGVVQTDITNMNNGYVVVEGRLSDLDTQAYANGTQLYLSPTTAGTWTSTKPYAPNHLVYVGIVVRSHPTQGVVEVKIMNGFEMDELHNVAAQSPDNNDILQYKTATSLWTKVAGTTSNIAEGSNLYYTDARSRAALSFTAGSGAYNSTTGVITIPTNTNQLTNGAAFITLTSLAAGAGISYNNTTGVIASTITQYTDAMARASISLTTTGTSGAATYNNVTGVLNIPQYQTALTNPVTGTGTTNYLPKFTGTSTIGNSVIQEASGSIGINVSPVADLQVGKSSGVTIAMSNSSSVTSGTRGGISWYNSNVSTVADIRAVAVTDNVGTQLEFYTRPVGGSLTQAMTLNTSGNLGLGVTPSAWGGNARVFEGSNGSALSSNVAAPETALMSNAFYNGSSWIYKTSSQAARYSVNGYNGSHTWEVAPSGTAGNAISFTQAMTLDASGRLGIGTTSPGYKLNVVGGNEVGSRFIVTGTYAPIQFSGDNSTTLGGINAYSGIVAIGRGTSTGVNPDIAINSNGNVGIGTTSPNSYLGGASGLSVYNASLPAVGLANTSKSWMTYLTGSTYRIYNITDAVIGLDIASTGAATFSSSVTATRYNIVTGTSTAAEINFSNTANNWSIKTGTTSNTFGIYENQFGGIPLFISGGNVGIGTTSPAAKLHIESASASYGLLRITSTTGSGGEASINYGRTDQGIDSRWTVGQGTASIGDSFGFYSGGANRFVLTTAGAATFSSSVTASSLTVGSLGSGSDAIISLATNASGSPRTIYYKASTAAINFTGTGGSDLMTLTNGGNVEIATGSIKTGEPDTGWGRAAIKIGASVSGAAFNVTRYLPVNVDGTVYFINLNSSTP